jgi:hypothetical protein
MQRARYPACHGQSRLAAYPTLATNPRRFCAQEEPRVWQLQPVLDYIASRCWTRWVDKVGRISLFNNAYSVGRAYRHQRVHIHLDRHTRQWVIENDQGQVRKTHPCAEITLERIDALTLVKRPNLVAHEPA